MNGILSFLRNRPALKGRLLLLSDRLVEEGRWSEWIPKLNLKKLEEDEAVQALEIKLREADLDIDIPVERRKEVVRDLDFNPRAIEALVGALRYETLDEIIGSNPGLWAVRDRAVSREFLTALERDLLQRTMSHLEPAHLDKLRWLAVHRRSFKRQALDKLCKSHSDATHLKNLLVVRYLANFHLGDFSLNSLVREISLAHLRDTPIEFRQAHSNAADYHLRHFKAKQIVVGQSRLGESFAELRYHLTQAGRQAELRDIGHRFTDHLKQQIKSVTPVPTDREELDERIGVLTILLENGGAKGLEFHLARCLQTRAKTGDLQEAVKHAERASGSDSPEESWYLLAKLTLEAEGVEPAVVVIHRSLHALRISPPMCLLGAEILESAQRVEEAVTLLKDGIKVTPPEKNLSLLYQLCAEMLVKAGKLDEAAVLLKTGIETIPPDKNLAPLYQLCAEILMKSGKPDEAAMLLKAGIEIIPPDKNLAPLYQLCAEILAKAGKLDEAAMLLKAGIEVIPPDKNLVGLYQAMGETFCKAGKVDDALSMLRNGIERLSGREERRSLIESFLLIAVAANREDLLAQVHKISSEGVFDKRAKSLAGVLLKESNEDWSSAAAMADIACRDFPRDHAFWGQYALSLLSIGKPDLAAEAASHLGITPSGPAAWLVSFIELRNGNHANSVRGITRLLDREPASHELTEEFLLSIWDEQIVMRDGHRICFHLPILSPSITGRLTTARRVQFSAPVLSAPEIYRSGPTNIKLMDTKETLDVYVSYAWGEDTTLVGRQREEIVDRLCEVIKRTGRKIGRDKERLQGGDSIERFAHEISRAPRIIAVISEKSLQSDFCMAQELFRAYRRCDYQRVEFQEKIIALVMDDAKPLLASDLSLVKLAEHWKEKFETLHESLRSIDPNRKSHDLWVLVDLIEEMVPRLPGMLAVLKDVVMKRGFDAIVADQFNEVLNRLPPTD
jgi:tetratricopeptide (TPR) repeat protein